MFSIAFQEKEFIERAKQFTRLRCNQYKVVDSSNTFDWMAKIGDRVTRYAFVFRIDVKCSISIKEGTKKEAFLWVAFLQSLLPLSGQYYDSITALR